MKRQIVGVVALFGLSGLGLSVMAGERPQVLDEFAAQQHAQILDQGNAALAAIEHELQTEYAMQRMAFVESQQREIVLQGKIALAAIKEEVGRIDSREWEAGAFAAEVAAIWKLWPTVVAVIPPASES